MAVKNISGKSEADWRGRGSKPIEQHTCSSDWQVVLDVVQVPRDLAGAEVGCGRVDRRMAQHGMSLSKPRPCLVVVP